MGACTRVFLLPLRDNTRHALRQLNCKESEALVTDERNSETLLGNYQQVF